MSSDHQGSPTPVPDDIIPIRDHIPPEVMIVQNVRGESLELSHAPWLKALCDAKGQGIPYMDLWNEYHGDWATNALATLAVHTERTTVTVLLRLTHVSYCEGLGVEISLLEQVRGRYAVAKLEQFDLTSKNGCRPVRVAVWNENNDAEAKVYTVSLSREDTFSISTHPALLLQAVGAAGLPSTPALFEMWDIYAERWIAKKIGEPINVAPPFNLVLLRRQGNYLNVGAGYAIGELQLTRAIAEKKSKFDMLKAKAKNKATVGQEPTNKKRRRIENPANHPAPSVVVPVQGVSPIVVPRSPNGGPLVIDLSYI